MDSSFYLYPTYFDDELLDVILHEDKICKYVDIPLQHISNAVLTRMHRRDSSESIYALLRKLRAARPRMTIRTTLMVGFPGETEADFQELCDFIREIKFDDMGAFTFSPQDGTPAARMTDQIDEEVKEDRYHQLMAIQAGISEETMNASLIPTRKSSSRKSSRMARDINRLRAVRPIRRPKSMGMCISTTREISSRVIS